MIGKYSNQDFLKIYMDIVDELRESGQVFSQQNPELAPYLDLSNRKSNDPETERLIESFAYMFAQVEHKSILAQSDYALNFVDHVFPELISPVPALTTLKIVPKKSFFSKEETNFLIPKSTPFLAQNQTGIECQFTSCQDMTVSCLNITDALYVDSSISKEDIGKHKKAFILNFESLVPLTVNKQSPLLLQIYIDLDFYSALSIYDCIFASKKPLCLLKDDGKAPIFLPRKNINPIYKFESEDKNNNNLYPMFDFLNYYQKYFFFELKIDEEFLVKDKFKLIIPVEESFVLNSRVGNSFLQLNCLPVINTFEKKMEPMKCSKEKDEYYLRVDGVLQNEFEILNIKSVKTYNAKTGEAIGLSNFHAHVTPDYDNIKNQYADFIWSTRRSFYDPTMENGSIYLKILLKGKKLKDELIWPDYLFPTGVCTNSKMVDSIKPKTPFQCVSNVLPIDKAYSLFWSKHAKRPLKHYGNTEVLKLLYRVNQEIISDKILKGPEFEKVMSYLCSDSNPVCAVIKQIFIHSSSFIFEESISQQVWKKQTFHIPGYVYRFQFLKSSGFPRGTMFLINFLNAYFDYIREFNFNISFEAELL